MANKSLFMSLFGKAPAASARNEAGAPAYAMAPKLALAQLATTGCFNGTYYAKSDEQLDTLKSLMAQVQDNTFLAKLAIYSRDRAFMKDMPAALVATLASRDTALFHKVFDRVIDNGRVLRTLFQMIRSGAFGKKSLTSSIQRAFQRWLNRASVEKLLSASIGNDPSLRDVLRMARPTPKDNERRALFGWLANREVEKWAPATESDLPDQAQKLRSFRAAETANEQVALLKSMNARWDLLADSAKGTSVWIEMGKSMGPQALRMNLNTLERHGVFESREQVEYFAKRLEDQNEVRRSRQFPYQYFAAYLNASDKVPQRIKTALSKAAEIACDSIPQFDLPVVIGVDVSGSMSSPVTGHRGNGSTSKMRCVDVAALFAAAILRRNPESVVIPFDQSAYRVKLDPSDSILSLAARLASYGGGGTDCSLPIVTANRDYSKQKFAGIVLVSDSESWIYKGCPWFYGASGSTGVVEQWNKFVKNQQRLQGESARPKLICMNLQPYATTQAPERPDVLNIGGFSDAVFEVVSSFLFDDASRFVNEIEAISIDA